MRESPVDSEALFFFAIPDQERPRRVQFPHEVKHKAGEFLKDNATLLLTAGGVVGTVATAVLTAQASFKAAEIIRNKELEHIHPEGVSDAIDSENATMGLSATQKVKLVWPHFLPPVIAGTATITAIIFSHRMSSAKIAGLAAAYGLAERNLGEYKEKVAEKLTGPKKTQIDDELAQDRVNRTDGYQNLVIVEGEVLCFDEPTARYFRSTMENIKQAVNSTNAEILHHEFATATHFYEELGLTGTTWTDEVGWNADQLLELKYSTVLSPDGRPCIAIDFKVLPKPDYVPKHY